MLLIGKPSISMGHLYHGYVSHNQTVTIKNGGDSHSSDLHDLHDISGISMMVNRIMMEYHNPDI